MTDTNGTNYNILIEPVHEGNEFLAAETLGACIGLDVTMAEKILRKAPIALFRNLPQPDLDFLRPHLDVMKDGGLNFRITRRNVDELPKVNWPGDTNPDLRLLFGDDEDEHIGGDEELAAELDGIDTNGHRKTDASGTDTAKIPPPAPGEATFDFSCPCCEAVFQIVKVGTADPQVTQIGPPRVNPLGPASEPAGRPTPAPLPAAAHYTTHHPEPTPELVESPMEVAAASAGGFQIHGNGRFGRRDESSLADDPMDAMGIESMGHSDDFGMAAPAEEIEEMEELDAAEVEVETDFAMDEPAAIAEAPATPGAYDDGVFRVLGEEVVDLVDPRLVDDASAAEMPAIADDFGIALAPAAPVAEVDVEAVDDLAELETMPEDGERINHLVKSLDGDDLDLAGEVEGIDEIEAVEEEDEDLEPWTGRARDYKDPELDKKQPTEDEDVISAEVVEDDDEEDELEPWTGRARDYKDPELAKPKPAVMESEDLVSAEIVEEEDEDSLEPWTGRARDYKDPALEQQKPAPVEDDDDGLEPWTGRARDYKDPALEQQKPAAKPAAASQKSAKQQPAVTSAKATPAKPAGTKPPKKATEPAPSLDFAEEDELPEPSAADLDLTDELPELDEEPVTKSKKKPSEKTGAVKPTTGKVSKKTSKVSGKKKKKKKKDSLRNTQRLKGLSDDELIGDEIDVDGEEDIAETIGIDFDNLPDLGDDDAEDDGLSLDGGELSLDDDDGELSLEDDVRPTDDISLDDELDGDVLDEPASGGGSDGGLDFGDVGAEAEATGSCTVFLNKIKPSDKQKAIDMIAEFGKMSKGEATKLSDRLVIPVVKNVSRTEADEILNKFKKAGLSGRIRDN